MANTLTVSTKQFTYLDMDNHLLINSESIVGASRIAVAECDKRIRDTGNEAPLYIRCGDDTRLVYVNRVDFFTDPAGFHKDETRLAFRKVAR